MNYLPRNYGTLIVNMSGGYSGYGHYIIVGTDNKVFVRHRNKTEWQTSWTSLVPQADFDNLLPRFLYPTNVLSNIDLDTLISASDVGTYKLGANVSNIPPTTASASMLISRSDNYNRQTVFCGYSSEIYTRVMYYSNGWKWSSWQKITFG